MSAYVIAETIAKNQEAMNRYDAAALVFGYAASLDISHVYQLRQSIRAEAGDKADVIIGGNVLW